MFAHKIVKTTVNSWAGEESRTENYGVLRRAGPTAAAPDTPGWEKYELGAALGGYSR